MKITDRRENAVMEFDKLEIGDVFQQNDLVYIKVSNYVYNNDGSNYHNALLLDWLEGVGEYHFDSDEKVVFREAELILK